MLKAIVDNLDQVEESYRGLYTERNGKFEITAIEGIKTQGDVDRISAALTKEKNDHKALKDRVSLLGDKKIEDVVSLLDRIPELEAAAQGKIDDEKLNEIVEGRIKSKLAPIEREKGQLAQKLQELSSVVEQYQVKEKIRAIHDSVREAISKSEGFQPGAIEDALMFAERMFAVDESGKALTKEEVGVTPLVEASVWLTEMQNRKPHWWGESSGSGAGGSRKLVFGATNPWAHDTWNMTEQGKLLLENRAKAEQMAKAAGTTIGGPKPIKK